MSFFHFFGIKRDRITVAKLIPNLDGTWWWQLICLEFTLNIFDRKTQCYWKTWFFVIFHFKNVGQVHFSKNCTDCKKKASIESNQHHIPIPVSQFLPNLAIWEDFIWDDCLLLVNHGHVSTFVSIHTKFRAFDTTTIFRVIISIDLITTLGSVGCYILLLPAYKVEMQVKR